MAKKKEISDNMNEKLLEPDYSKKHFKITIEVCQNCQTFEVTTVDGCREPTYVEIIGALEIQKGMMMYDQSKYNREQFKKQQDGKD